MVDVLHTMDLGLTAVIIGSIMFAIACLRKRLGGSNYEEGANRLSSHLKKWYKKRSARLVSKVPWVSTG